MRRVEYLLNGHRTRIIESFLFDRDRKVDLPRTLSAGDACERTALISELVLDWQVGIPISSLSSSTWRQRESFCMQIGCEDGYGLSGLPQGAIVSVEPIGIEERLRPDPNVMYCLQFGDGYRCSGCAVDRGQLILIPCDNSYAGPHIFFYPEQARIVGRVTWFATALPPVPVVNPKISRGLDRAPLILPWEQPNLASLWRTESERSQLNGLTLERANEIFALYLGIHLSSRTLRRYRQEAQMIPHTDVLIALTLFHATRFREVFHQLGLWENDANRSSLARWTSARSVSEAHALLSEAVVPKPHDRWDRMLKEWGGWPELLSLSFPSLNQLKHRLLRVQKTNVFDGLSPLIKSGAIILLEETDKFPEPQSDMGAPEWERSVYAIRVNGRILCGYIYNDGRHFTLIPHHLSQMRRVSFLRHQVSMVGKWIGVASPLRSGNHATP
ncbi:MAG: hypothetical protein WA634_20570 [Silvibacterium sp.]